MVEKAITIMDEGLRLQGEVTETKEQLGRLMRAPGWQSEHPAHDGVRTEALRLSTHIGYLEEQRARLRAPFEAELAEAKNALEETRARQAEAFSAAELQDRAHPAHGHGVATWNNSSREVADAAGRVQQLQDAISVLGGRT